MPEPLQPVLAQVRSDLLDRDRLVRVVAAGRRRGRRPAYRRTDARWVDLREGPRLQVVEYGDQQAFTRNVVPAEAPAVVDALLAEPYGNWHVQTTEGTTQVRVTKSGEAQVHRSRSAPRPPDRAHDRAKPRLLDPAAPFLSAVGISDAGGVVKPSRRDKFRQVEEFLRALEPVLESVAGAAGAGPVRVVDLGCGNAYLTFAAYHWLAERHGLDVRLTGVDVKAQARKRNTRLAESLGWSERLGFVEGTIAGAAVEHAPHLVLALHACDTATDDALARAVRWEAPVVLAAPCCHHDIQRQLRLAGGAPHPYSALTRHGILRERFADVLTDALRASLLRLAGYRVEVVEFVDSRHTPRNALIRAVRTGARPEAHQIREYEDLVAGWNVRPALAERLTPSELPGLSGPAG